ncbi:autotransporter domain-containing protein [Escherichia sp. E4694]|uniref:BigA/YdbA N-terminal beta-barrel domain-containing protein n=1 Tax=Escherichia sp. E4694 TaxID=2044464 RepID=UPI0010818716|nr:autotransporter outer membrane beta-barrel domain-containing protein [Escherichia sp. E4694]TGB75704.1 autotransporter domain-containing protein [Escherichia sp. E4694]
MQRKTLLSACIALALSGQGWAADITETETATGEKKNTNVTCPADPDKLTPEALKQIPPECSPQVQQNLMPWVASGAFALITALAVVELNDDGNHHHRNNAPVPPTPPDDDSDETPVPPTPGGDDIIPDDGQDDPPTPPKPISFNNDVIFDKTAKTLTIRDTVFTYSENADGTISLQDSNGRKVTINLWQIDEANNTVALEGVSPDGAITWQYNHNGELIITGDNATVNNNGKTTVDGKDSTGTEINGNNGKVIQDGDLDVSGGGHGIDITGDSATVDNNGTMTVTDPESIGIQIDGDQAVVNNDGDSSISNGGTGTQINGDDATANNGGKTTVDGKDATGTEINGNNGTVIQDGDLDVSGGGHGIDITGDSATVDNNGTMTVTDPESIGIQIDGDQAVVNNEGDSTITNGGTGTQINGDDATANNNGKTTIDGKDSTGTEIAGNNATVNQNGDLNVSGGAHGMDITGDSATVNNKGTITVTDEGSIGIQIEGENATFSNTGKVDVTNSATGFSITTNNGDVSLAGDMQIGDFSTGLVLNGDDNKLTLATTDLNVTGQSATGVNVNGDGNNVDITGNIKVDKDQLADNGAEKFYDTSTGISIKGNNNNTNVDGKLTVVADSETTTQSYLKYDGGQENISGLVVTGDDNIINLNSGIHLVGEANQLTDGSAIAAQRKGYGDVQVISVDGQSTVHLKGDSTISGDFPLGYESIIQLNNKAILEVDVGATLSMGDITSYDHYNTPESRLIGVNSGASAINNGDIALRNIGFATVSNADSTGINNGSITLEQYFYGQVQTAGAGFFATQDGNATNNGTITAKIMQQQSVMNIYSDLGSTTPAAFYNRASGTTGMESFINGSVVNTVDGIIDLYGRGTIGMLAIDNSTADNAGKISLDSLWVDVNDTTTLNNNIGSADARDFGVGMAVGTDTGSSPKENAVATNQQGGVITVYNAGAGMAAYGASNIVINQGTINLEKNSHYDANLAANTLVGMAVYNYGTAINDQTGIININVDTGQAFYNDGTGTIFNYGAINLFGVPMDEADPHMGATTENKDLLRELSKSGESVTKTSTKDGFIITAPLVNNGNETLNGDLKASNWLYNEENASLTVNGKLDIIKGLENKGVLESDTINASTSIYNRASGSITTDLLTLNGGINFYNEGIFSGVINGTSYKQNIVNTGDMTVTADGSSLINGSFLLYNEAGSTLTNSGNAIAGGENAIVNVTRTGDSLAQVNRGTITATNGYSAIKTANTGSNSNGKWIWNTETGVINGINPTAPLIDLGRGYNFANAGTINIQGDGAVAISGGATSYTIQLVNSGTINVGTEQGKADGSNGEGLIGIKGNGSATTINNTKDGVINLYADNSWAFGGSTKAIVNNGIINLLCNIGCDIYAPNTTGTRNDHDGTTDITVPNASATPGQGNVPAAPVESVTQQKLTNYTIGTNSDGSSGTLRANNLIISDNVTVNTGFSAGTADTSVVIDDVFKGENISGVENITSSSVVWNAKGSTDVNGNVDVTMSKNAYTEVATDASVNDVAKALDASYTNNELYTSLNVGTTAELNSALKQISGSQATTVFREARVLSNRFSMLADAAPKVGNGLAFNVVAKGDPRAELGNNTEYDMLALRKTIGLSESQTMSLEYGIARLDGDGAQKAGDNGVTGGYSQFFGLKHQMSFENGMSWNNALRYDVHNLDSSRSIAFSNTSKTADTDVKQQYLEFRSEGAKTFEPSEGLKLTPYAGIKLRHTLEGGYQERNAGDFNLSMNSGSETAVDSIVGLKLDYAGKDGWSANATLEGGPNLSYAKSQRTASLAGAGSQHFNVDDGQKGGGINNLASVGVKYSSKESSLNLDAYHWKEDSISDKGVMLNFKKTF